MSGGVVISAPSMPKSPGTFLKSGRRPVRIRRIIWNDLLRAEREIDTG
jgi:hypothetical protein